MGCIQYGVPFVLTTALPFPNTFTCKLTAGACCTGAFVLDVGAGTGAGFALGATFAGAGGGVGFALGIGAGTVLMTVLVTVITFAGGAGKVTVLVTTTGTICVITVGGAKLGNAGGGGETIALICPANLGNLAPLRSSSFCLSRNCPSSGLKVLVWVMVCTPSVHSSVDIRSYTSGMGSIVAASGDESMAGAGVLVTAAGAVFVAIAAVTGFAPPLQEDKPHPPNPNTAMRIRRPHRGLNFEVFGSVFGSVFMFAFGCE